MAVVKFSLKGNFNNTERFFSDAKTIDRKYTNILHKYGEAGVRALTSATPYDTGRTMSSWSYHVEDNTVYWTNSNIPNGARVSVAILIQYGHATGTGGYVSGIDFINPAMRPIFDEIVRKLDEEVRSL